jgi:hypothetical protein
MTDCNVGRGCDCWFTGCRIGITSEEWTRETTTGDPTRYSAWRSARLRSGSGRDGVSVSEVPGNLHTDSRPQIHLLGRDE